MTEILPEVQAFAADIAGILADDSASLSLRETPGEPGSEPTVSLLVRGEPLFHFRRDEFLEAMYVLGCDVMEDLQRAGLPLAVTTSRGPVH